MIWESSNRLSLIFAMVYKYLQWFVYKYFKFRLVSRKLIDLLATWDLFLFCFVRQKFQFVQYFSEAG